MAKLFPENALDDETITKGEKKVLLALAQGLNDSCYLWYEPQVGNGRMPDIILYYPGLGLLIFEVKDWSVNRIKSVSPAGWEVQTPDGITKKTDPLKQAKSYFYALCDQCKKENLLINKEPAHKGKIKLPVAVVAAFPNIQRNQYKGFNFDKAIPEKLVFLKDDIEELQNAPGEKQLYKMFKNLFEPWFSHEELEREELNQLRGLLHPELSFSNPASRNGDTKNVAVITLDEFQEQVALKIGTGHRMVRGVAGSGKSLVLCAKARIWHKENPNHKILIVCYNVSLVAQLKHFLSNMGCGKEILILTWHKLARRVFGKNTDFPEVKFEELRKMEKYRNHSDEYVAGIAEEETSRTLGEMVIAAIKNGVPEQYDFILVDEAQDMHTTWLKSLTLLSKKNTVLLAEDPNQKIYKRNTVYKDAGLNLVGGGKIFNLPISYRSTKEIILSASKFLQKSKDWDDFYRKFLNEENLNKNETQTVSTGTQPTLQILPKMEDTAAWIIHDIKEKVKQYNFSYSEFSILFVTNKYSEPGNARGAIAALEQVNYPEFIRERLKSSGIPYYFLTFNREAKSKFNPNANTVTLSTVFSSKGLEFKVVYIIGLEMMPLLQRNIRENKSLMYVGMTRAKEYLHMFSRDNTNFTKELSEALK